MTIREISGLVIATLLATGCTASEAVGEGGFPPGGGGGRPPVQPPPQQPTSRLLPAALVGVWNGQDSRGIGSWYLAFQADGRYRRSNERRGITITGTATVQGTVIMFSPEGGRPYSSTWAAGGGRLSIDGSVYLRADQGQGASALVGSWIDTSGNYWATLRISADGTFQLADQAGGGVAGKIVVSGRQLTLQAAGRNPVTCGWAIDNGVLRLVRPDGAVSEYVRSG
ncbi:hypothetical protein [Frankia sp. QA3]|uniref:hypothetical protein n=1 Tax=Frankia sp. QA3 TaxID=710111 RepID=UPI0018DEEADA|nr:hypothetical protein [Frankia sp. QA3]